MILSKSELNCSNLEFIPKSALVFNTIVTDKKTNTELDRYFQKIWEDKTLVDDLKAEVLGQIERGFKSYSSRDLFYFSLNKIFGDQIHEQFDSGIIKKRTGIEDTLIWQMLYKFQLDGVLGAIDKIEKYNGCIIADSVGLGKTFEALAIIKYYELRNDRVLVLCPKKLRDNWAVYTLNDKRNILLEDRFNFDVLNHTDLTRTRGFSGAINLETVNWNNYDLVVIDESHNFRNNNPAKDRENRYGWLMKKIIRSGVRTKVLMLSATPVNNRINDLKNQVAFITEGNDVALENEGISSINQVMRSAQQQFNQWLKNSSDRKSSRSLLNMLDSRYFKILDLLTIARSRKHIEKYYDLSKVGEFPERLKPINNKSDIDIDGKFPALMDINRHIWLLNLSTYAPLKYLRSDKIEEYGNRYDLTLKQGSVFKQIDREESLIYLMRVNLFKRLESSIRSFAISLKSILDQVEVFLEKIQNKSEYFDETLSINEIEIDDVLLSDYLIGNKVKVLFQDMDIVKWKNHLLEDKKRLEQLMEFTDQVTADRDKKLNELKNIITEKVRNPINENNRKVLIFTAFADTAFYLYDNIKDWAEDELNIKSALVTGTGLNKSNYERVSKNFNEILTSFSPISKQRKRIYGDLSGEIDILIATDCISEGQNLQDCDFVVNYDIHWNPVRIVQRFGRIDRIGSLNSKIQLVNFWPNLELEEYINLEKRVSSRMILLDISATGEENLIIPQKEMNDLDYRREQLKKMQDKVIDLEEIQGGISITDMSYNDFRFELSDYLKQNKAELLRIPSPMKAKIKTAQDEAEEGVIFCLKKVISSDLDSFYQNALEPYYLIYMNKEGEQIFSISENKQILDLMQKLSSDGIETNSSNIDSQNLLKNAVEQIIGKVQEAGTDSLFKSGGTLINRTEIKNIEDFEVISYLEINLGTTSSSS